MPYRLSDRRVWVAGHRGLVGSAICRRLEREDIRELITATSDELDLRRQDATESFVREHAPDVVILAAARAGGIKANMGAQADFLYDNTMIATNVVAACRQFIPGSRVVYLGSSCVYPRHVAQPMQEGSLLDGKPEPTNEGYAVAKILGVELITFFREQYGLDGIALTPTNLYGPGDDFDPEHSHVLAALIRRIHEAKVSAQGRVTIWGSGTPRRELMHVDDLADAVIFATMHYDGIGRHLNIGTGEDSSIRELASLVADVVGWRGNFDFDTSMPDGMPRKLLDVWKLHDLGWHHRIELRDGIAQTYDWYVSTLGRQR